MPIQITCSNCHTRFKVSDQFAGREGPCPKCKATIRVPDKSEEVIIHAPDNYGPKDSEGRSVLKPIEREEAKITPVGIVGIVGAVFVALLVTFLIGRHFKSSGEPVPMWLLATGAVVVAPPLVLAGYTVMRDQELEPYRGGTLALRVAICACVYAFLWAAYAYVGAYLFGSDGKPEIFQLAFLIPALGALGGVAPLAALDLDYLSGCMHCGVYLFVCVLLRLLMGMSAF